MPCNQTSYPHGNIPANRTFYTFGATAESECYTVCHITADNYLDGEQESIDRCNRIINGEEGWDIFQPELNRFNYVEAGMVCEPCTPLCFEGPSSGCNFQVGIEYCCIDGQYLTPDGVSYPCSLLNPS